MQVLSASVAWRVYEMTRDPLSLGLVGLAQFAPMFALTLYAGDVADRYSRRVILALSYVVEALCAGLFMAVTWAGITDPNVYFAILVLFGSARAFSAPASQSFLPQIVPADLLPRAISISSSAMQVAVISGPALGGAALLLGAGFAFGLSLALFAMVGCVIFAIRIERPRTAPPSGSLLERVAEGIVYVRRRRELFGAISLDLFAVLLGGATALLPFFANEILHVGPLGFGLLKAAPAIGAAAMSFWLTAYPIGRHAGMKMFACVGIFGIATIIFGLSGNFWLSFAALIVLGASDMVSVNVRQATPDHMRGRWSRYHVGCFVATSSVPPGASASRADSTNSSARRKSE